MFLLRIIMKNNVKKNMTVKEFIDIYNKKWRINHICHKCKTITTRPLKNFINCFLELGVIGDTELTEACKEYTDAEQKIWELLDKHDFEFIEDEL